MIFQLNSSTTLLPSGALDGAQLMELGRRYAPQLVAGLAVVGIAWQAAQLTWLGLASGTGNTMAQPVSCCSPAAAAERVNPQQVADAHLFGIAGAPSTGADPNNLPQTSMSLVLAGTMALDDPEAGYAIVGETAASAKFYKVGASINGSARLHSVYPERVIIERNGTLETLILPRGTPSTAPVPSARTVANTNTPGDNLRRLASSNPSALGELMRAQPVFSNGVQKGYRVYPGRDRQQFTRLGLQPGDLVTAINGSALDDPNRGTEILNTLTSATTAQVTVERNGASQQLTLDMAQLALPESSSGASSSESSGNSESPRGGFNGPPGNRGLAQQPQWYAGRAVR
ncbi:type II secretion system protein GspC [Arenimonas sp.]|uniref:type II secretion system protein GspC n=1 Tax=Arenimonas sp. TaxID=1872635 RepID=UPI0039E4715A